MEFAANVYLVYIFYSLLSSLYLCREFSTNSLLFMQNKANLLNAQMNVSSVLTKYYENIANWKLGENKPNSKPIKPNTNLKQTQFAGCSNERKLSFNKVL